MSKKWYIIYLWAAFCMIALSIRAVIVLIYNNFDVSNPFLEIFGGTVFLVSLLFLVGYLATFSKKYEQETKIADVLQNIQLLKESGFLHVSETDVLEGNHNGYFCRVLAGKTKENTYHCEIECIVQIKEYEVQEVRQNVPLKLEETVGFYLFSEEIEGTAPLEAQKILAVLDKMIETCQKHYIKAYTPRYAFDDK